MPDEKKLLCPQTFNAVISAGVRDPEDEDFRCHREDCAWYDGLWKTCTVLAQGMREGELITIMENIAREMLELRGELQRVRGAIEKK